MRADGQRDGRGLTVLQWNVGNFDVRLRPRGDGPRGMRYTHATASREEDIPDMGALIRSLAPDVVTLQEVVVSRGHHDLIAKAAGYQVAAAGESADRHTQAILVRPGLSHEPGPRPEGFNGVTARVRWPEGAEVIAVSTHSSAGRFTGERATQHRALASWARQAAREAPVVAGGDFNFDDATTGLHARLRRLGENLPLLPPLASTDWEEDGAALAALRESLVDAGAPAGPTAGAPRLWPKILLPWGAPLIPLAWALGFGRLRSRLDYVWVSKALEPVEARVLRLTGPRPPDARNGRPPFPWMDHDPVAVRLKMVGGTGFEPVAPVV